ncbi:hypothetical protein [Neobacillus sp. DY30]|uniref:hypothetical protein n=1 Tax=Neobacillus sp. DY30 TaxID=3047871 RepID=UPI0024BFD8EE|nr:hypothetical protein [Neobacillus sp. DY30]WHX99279.1 hypothetical protein QNH29_22200 [Neobacillus sp. DY30]
MKKWAFSALVYLLVVVGGYYVYASFTDETDSHNDTTVPHEQEAETSQGHEHEENRDNHDSESEVITDLQVLNNDLIININDLKGNPVSDLEVNHEKLLHLIVVSSDLKEYHHLHPQTYEPGVFKVPHLLPAGEYKAFVDIKPKGKKYKVTPISFMVGEHHTEHKEDSLTVDSELTKEAGGHTVKLFPSALKVNEDIQLTFDLGGDTPEQYLGALGHVVILDQKGQNYVHVHPLEGNKPVFSTKFSEPGIYKIWAEFKFNGKVFVFPYVVEIK